MDANQRMPGDAEAAGAVAGMHDTYGPQATGQRLIPAPAGPASPFSLGDVGPATRHGHAIGDEFWFQPTVGAMPRPGRVVGLFGDGRMEMAERDGSTHVISAAQVAEF